MGQLTSQKQYNSLPDYLEHRQHNQGPKCFNPETSYTHTNLKVNSTSCDTEMLQKSSCGQSALLWFYAHVSYCHDYLTNQAQDHIISYMFPSQSTNCCSFLKYQQLRLGIIVSVSKGAVKKSISHRDGRMDNTSVQHGQKTRCIDE